MLHASTSSDLCFRRTARRKMKIKMKIASNLKIRMKIKAKITMQMKMKGKRRIDPHTHQGVRLAFSTDLPAFSR